MAKKESNIGIYIFWGVIVVAIIAVIVIFVFPKSNTQQAYSNLQTVIASSAEKVDEDNHSLDYYITTLKNLNTDQKYIIDNLYKIQQILTNGNEFNLRALTFVNANNSYKSLVKKQSDYERELSESLDDLQLFVSNYIVNFLKTSYNPSQLDERIDIVSEKYKNVIIAYSNFYAVTAEIAEASAVRCMEVCEGCLQDNVDITIAVQNMLETENYSNLSNLLSISGIKYSSNYYKTYF